MAGSWIRWLKRSESWQNLTFPATGPLPGHNSSTCLNLSASPFKRSSSLAHSQHADCWMLWSVTEFFFSCQWPACCHCKPSTSSSTWTQLRLETSSFKWAQKWEPPIVQSPWRLLHRIRSLISSSILLWRWQPWVQESWHVVLTSAAALHYCQTVTMTLQPLVLGIGGIPKLSHHQIILHQVEISQASKMINQGFVVI